MALAAALLPAALPRHRHRRRAAGRCCRPVWLAADAAPRHRRQRDAVPLAALGATPHRSQRSAAVARQPRLPTQRRSATVAARQPRCRARRRHTAPLAAFGSGRLAAALADAKPLAALGSGRLAAALGDAAPLAAVGVGGWQPHPPTLCRSPCSAAVLADAAPCVCLGMWRFGSSRSPHLAAADASRRSHSVPTCVDFVHGMRRCFALMTVCV